MACVYAGSSDWTSEVDMGVAMTGSISISISHQCLSSEPARRRRRFERLALKWMRDAKGASNSERVSQPT